MSIPTFPPWFRIPLALSRAELWWLSYLWLAWAYAEQRAEQFTRAFWAKYEANRRLDELCMRPSPVLQRIMKEASRAG